MGEWEDFVDADGSVTGVPGTIYQVNVFTGEKKVVYRPSQSSGGSAPTTYRTVTVQAGDQWAQGGIAPGTVIQVASSGQVQIVDSPDDANGDGYNDKTNLPVGVTSVNGKLYYQGKEVNPDGSLKTEANNVKIIVSDGSDGFKAGTSYYWENGVPKILQTGVGVDSTPSGGGGGGGSILFRQFGAGGKGMAEDQGGGNQMSASERIALINAKVNAAKAYAESLMTYDPNQYSAFLSAAGGNLANAISSGRTALSARAIKPSQDILNQITQLDRQLGTHTDLSSAGDLSGGYFGQAAIPRYAYGTAPGVMRNNRNGGLSGGGNQQGNQGWRTANATPLTPTQQYEQQVLRAYNMWHFPHATSIGDIPYNQLRRIQKGIANSQANMQAAIDRMNAQPPVVKWNADYTMGTYVDLDGHIHMGSSEQLKPIIDADRQKEKALWSMTPAERLIYNSMQPKKQPAMAFGTWGLGNYGGGDGIVAAANAKKPNTVPEVAADGGTTTTTTPPVETHAYGGLSTARMAIVGDPQHDGGPNPEIIYNPTGAPFSVTPMKNVVPLYAYGTTEHSSNPHENATERPPKQHHYPWENKEDPETTRLKAQYPWMNDPNYFMNVEFWKQDPILRDLYLKGLQMNKGIPMASVLASAEQNRLGGVSSNQMQVGW